jgi:hypothetical protein
LRISGQLAYDIAVVAMVCVLSIFFLPLAHGPYSAVHGPVTALRSLRTKLCLQLSMCLASLLRLAAYLLGGGLAGAKRTTRMVLSLMVPPEPNAVLRC